MAIFLHSTELIHLHIKHSQTAVAHFDQRGQQQPLSPITQCLYLIICACNVKERCVGVLERLITAVIMLTEAEWILTVITHFYFLCARRFQRLWICGQTVANHRGIIHLRERERERLNAEILEEREVDTCRYEEITTWKSNVYDTFTCAIIIYHLYIYIMINVVTIMNNFISAFSNNLGFLSQKPSFTHSNVALNL